MGFIAFSKVRFVLKVVQTYCSYIYVSFPIVIAVTYISEKNPISLCRKYRCRDVENVTVMM